MRRWKLEECAPVPWANGCGITRELAAERDGARFLWRISVAEIAAGGPFSSFPGLVRWHTITDGAGLDLQGEGKALRARPFEPLPFDGALELEAHLLDGPCRAFNVIYDPERIAAQVAVHAGAHLFDVAADAFVFVAAGTVQVSEATRLVAGDAIRPEATGALTPSADARVLNVRFSEVPA